MSAYKLTHHSSICVLCDQSVRTTLRLSRKVQTSAPLRRCRTFQHFGLPRRGHAVGRGLHIQAATSDVAACTAQQFVSALALERDNLRSHNLSRLSVYRLTALCAAKQQLHVATALSEVLALTTWSSPPVLSSSFGNAAALRTGASKHFVYLNTAPAGCSIFAS